MIHPIKTNESNPPEGSAAGSDDEQRTPGWNSPSSPPQLQQEPELPLWAAALPLFPGYPEKLFLTCAPLCSCTQNHSQIQLCAVRAPLTFHPAAPLHCQVASRMDEIFSADVSTDISSIEREGKIKNRNRNGDVMTGGKCIPAKTALWHLGSLGLQRQPWKAEQKTPCGFSVQTCGGGNWAAMILCHIKITQRWEITKYKAARTAKKIIQTTMGVIWSFIFIWLWLNRTQHATAAPSSGRWHSSSCKNSLTHSFLSPVFAKCQIQS